MVSDPGIPPRSLLRLSTAAGQAPSQAFQILRLQRNAQFNLQLRLSPKRTRGGEALAAQLLLNRQLPRQVLKAPD